VRGREALPRRGADVGCVEAAEEREQRVGEVLLAAADAALLELGDERLDERRRQPAVGGVEGDGMRTVVCDAVGLGARAAPWAP
jgi:hypothetical protein